MSYVVTAADRTSFRRGRRQWDFTAGPRQNLEAARPPANSGLDRAFRGALAVYYYPGMWDWDRGVRLPLVAQGLERALARQQEQSGEHADPRWWRGQLGVAQSLLTRYFAWAPSVNQFAPVLIEADYEVQVLDPASPSDGLVTAAGEAVRYGGRIDLMAVDQHDAYWIVRPRVVDGTWPPTEQLAEDEETLTACWAWEQFYLGMAITGIIYNELQRPPHPAGAPASGGARTARRWRWPRPRAAAPPAVRQHEPSGGGRSIPAAPADVRPRAGA